LAGATWSDARAWKKGAERIARTPLL